MTVYDTSEQCWHSVTCTSGKKTRIWLVRFFILKNYKNLSRMLHAPLARFANTCMHEFCAFAYKIALFLPFAFPENILHSILPFVLCFFIFFCKRNCVMIGAGFVLVEITAFCGVLSRVLCTIVCWLICFLTWFL